VEYQKFLWVRFDENNSKNKTSLGQLKAKSFHPLCMISECQFDIPKSQAPGLLPLPE
jgi:hypothetical protein